MQKPVTTFTYPLFVSEPSGIFNRSEPLLTVDLLKLRFLQGIEKIVPDAQNILTDEFLQDKIKIALNETEVLLGNPIVTEKVSERLAFDYNQYRQFIYLRTQYRVVGIEKLAIQGANQENFFIVPPQWIELGRAHQRQINVIPMMGAYYANTTAPTSAFGPYGSYIYILQRYFSFIPSYWTVEYYTGFSRTPGEVPLILNELIGIIATQNILSQIAPFNKHNSVSLSQDGIGQSSSNPGVQIFLQRTQELEARKQVILEKLKKLAAQKMFFGII
jgi:hypothetical protein